MLSLDLSNQFCIFLETRTKEFQFQTTVKPVFNDHPRDPKIVAVIDWLFNLSNRHSK